MFFCSNDDNMLYMEISEDKLVYRCKLCETKYNLDELKGSSKCVYKQNYNNNKYNYKTYLNKNVFEDKTLPIINNLDCVNKDCITNKDKNVPKEIVYIKYSKKDLKFVYFCKNCNYQWYGNNDKK